MQKHNKWEAMRKVVREIKNWSANTEKDGASTKEEGWFTPQELFETINAKAKVKKVSLRTVKYDLEMGEYIGIFKHDVDKGQYAWIDYSDDEPFILKAVEEYLDSHSQLQEGKHSVSYADVDEIIDLAVVKTGKPKKEIEELARKVIKKYFEQRR